MNTRLQNNLEDLDRWRGNLFENWCFPSCGKMGSPAGCMVCYNENKQDRRLESGPGCPPAKTWRVVQANGVLSMKEVPTAVAQESGTKKGVFPEKRPLTFGGELRLQNVPSTHILCAMLYDQRRKNTSETGSFRSQGKMSSTGAAPCTSGAECLPSRNCRVVCRRTAFSL